MRSVPVASVPLHLLNISRSCTVGEYVVVLILVPKLFMEPQAASAEIIDSPLWEAVRPMRLQSTSLEGLQINQPAITHHLPPTDCLASAEPEEEKLIEAVGYVCCERLRSSIVPRQ